MARKKSKVKDKTYFRASLIALAISAIFPKPRLAYAVGPGPINTTVNVNAGTVTIVGNTNVSTGAADATNVTGGTLIVDSSAPPSPGLITIEALTSGGAGLKAAGGSISVINDDVSVQTKAGHAVVADGVNSIITIPGGASIGTIGTGTAMVAINTGANIDATDAVIVNTSTGGQGNGAVAQSGGVLTLRGTSSVTTAVTTNLTNTVGLGAAAAGSQVTVTDPITITMQGRGEMAVYLFNGGQVSLAPNSVLQMNGASAIGVTADNSTVALGTIGSGLMINLDGVPTAGQSSSTGIVAFNTGNLNLENLTVQGAGAGVGVWARQNSSITLTGTNSLSINAAANATIYTLGSGSLASAAGTTSIFGVAGVLPISGFIASGGTITAENATVNVSSNNGVGAFAALNGGPTCKIDLTNSQITTTGTNSIGVQAGNNGQIFIRDSEITTSGGGAALFLGNSNVPALIDLTNTVANANGATTSGLVALSFGPGGTNQFNMSGGSLTSAQEATIAVQGLLNASINDGAVVTGKGGVLLEAFANANPPTSVVINAATGSVLNGDAQVITTPSLVDMNLSTNAIWNGAALGITNANVGATSLWNVTGNSLVTNQVANSGTISFVPAGLSFKTLTTNTYVGSNGTMNINTFLGTDGSPSDVLVINGGSATGDTEIFVANAGGGGDLTTNNGILVVSAISGATTNPDAFTLGAPVLAGPYEYLLFYGSRDASAPDSWFLRSTLASPPIDIPNYRRETSLYTTLPAMSFLYGRMLFDTLHARVGEEEQLRGRFDLQRGEGGWVRYIYRDGHHNGDGIFNEGPDFDYHFNILQGGFDAYRREHRNGSRDHAGFYIAAGHGRSQVEHLYGIDAGTDDVDAFTLGLYWTHFGPSGWYLDAIVQKNWYDFLASSGRMAPLTSEGSDIGASLEGGFPFKLQNDWIIEPQAQAIYQRISIHDTTDEAASVYFDHTDGILARLGVRVAHNWVMNQYTPAQRLTAWFRANQWYQFDADPRTKFSSEAGLIAFPAELSGGWLQLELGITGQVTRILSLYGTISHDFYYHHRGEASVILGGIRVNV